MLQQLTPPILRHISSQISQKRPLWGLLMANEYLTPGDSLRQSLCRKAAQTLHLDPCYRTVHSAIEAIENGKRLSELPYRMRRQIRNLIEDSGPVSTCRCIPPSLLGQRWQRNLRRRASFLGIAKRRAPCRRTAKNSANPQSPISSLSFKARS